MPQPTCPKCQNDVPAGSRFCHSCGSEVTTGTVGSQPVHQPRVRALNARTGVWIGGAVVTLLVIGWVVFLMTGTKNASHSTVAETREQLLIDLANTAGPVPDWLAKADQFILVEFAWAATHHDELQYIPCYCGCYSSSGHVNNSVCYFDRGTGDKIVEYDMHSYG